MDYIDIFNKETCNIFCDGSIKKIESTGETIGCPGCAIVLTDDYGVDRLVDFKQYILRDCTNNIAENRSLLLAVYSAIEYYRQGYKVNIFGDSQYCIFGITNWIFSWVNNFYNGHMYNSSGKIIENEQLIIELFNVIYYNQLNVNFYHQKGHVTSTDKSLENACKVFSKSNNIRLVDSRLVNELSKWNDLVDMQTKKYLNEFVYNYSARFNSNDYQIPASFCINHDVVDMEVYKNQIKRRVRYV